MLRRHNFGKQVFVFASLKYLLHKYKHTYINVQCALTCGDVYTLIHKPRNDVCICINICIFIHTYIQIIAASQSTHI